MFELEQIFVPVDFSRSARAAFELARHLGGGANRSGVRLQIAHVLPTLPTVMRQVLYPYAAMGEDELELEQELVDQSIEALHTHLELERFEQDPALLEPMIAWGKAKELLPEMLLRTPNDMVVMGAFGEGGPLPEALGSLAMRMLRTSACPVLLTRGLELKPRVRRVLCAIDLLPHSTSVLEVALRMALRLDADFQAVFVLPNPLEQNPNNLLSSHVKLSPQRLLEQERPKLEALFERTFKEIDLPYPQREHAAQLWRKRKVLFGAPARAIIEEADQCDADLVVLGARNLDSPHASQLGRVGWEVARAALTHVLVVPVRAESNALDAQE